METVRTRLKAMREAAQPKLSVRDMADKLGYGRENHNRYAYYETTFAKDVLPLDKAEEFASVLEQHGIDREDVLALAYGLDPDIADEPAAKGRAHKIDPSLLDRLNLAEIADVSIGWAMGEGAVVDIGDVAYRYFDRDWVKKITDAPAEHLRFMRGIGDSMTPTIHEDDAILINVAEYQIQLQDKIWAFTYGGLGMVKRVRQIPSKDEYRRYLIISDNPAVENFEASEDEIVVRGRVVWIGRKV